MSEQPKWTAGKWAVSEGALYRFWIGVDDGDKFTSVAEVGEATFSPENVEETRANAHLIAAAPDLYEALETLMQLRGESALCTEEVVFAEEAAQAALAKARGEA